MAASTRQLNVHKEHHSRTNPQFKVTTGLLRIVRELRVCLGEISSDIQTSQHIQRLKTIEWGLEHESILYKFDDDDHKEKEMLQPDSKGGDAEGQREDDI
ncbi:hypothetical protein PRZ48_010254 [Zasmidium cellare]|uniref:Uncharacterized protein n=1 Tax=Zasmidium cellare TaxID=395010 RepID=A0ABR0E8Q3_ZASCE|nr:hypothetical protein PRZ48_010254 [Zasmidium cellare]